MRHLLRTTIAALVVTLLVAAPAAAGIFYESVTTTESDQGSMGDGEIRAQGWVEGKNAKVAFVHSDQQMMKEGTWLVTRDGGETIYLVNPAEKTYMAWDMAGLMGGLGDMMKALGGMVQMSFENPEVTKVSQGDGPTILGYDTTHSVYDTSYTLVMSVMGNQMRTETETRQELWTTDEIDIPVHGVWLKHEPPKTGIEGLDEFIEKEMSKVADGFPLRTVAVTTTTQQGQTSTTTSTTEVTGVERKDVDEAIFAIPPDYTQVEMPNLQQMMQQQR